MAKEKKIEKPARDPVTGEIVTLKDCLKTPQFIFIYIMSTLSICKLSFDY